MGIQDAVSQVNQFKGTSLANTVANIESSMSQVEAGDVPRICEALPIGQELLSAAAAIKRASAQIDVVIHVVGIIYSLPYILKETEVIESVSLGAGNAKSGFDLVTDKQIAEFKFINWQGGSEALRKKTLFEDYFKLAREDTEKEKYLYLLNTEIPTKFLKGRSSTLRLLDRNKRLREDFVSRYEREQYRTVGQFYEAHKETICLVNLAEVVPGLDALIWEV